MKNIARSVLSFCAGALLVAGVVAAWPAVADRSSNLVVLSYNSPAERAHCEMLAATAGHRLFGPTDKQGYQTSCILKLSGNFDASGSLVLTRELRNPLDLQLLTRTQVYGSIPKAQIQHACANSDTGSGAGCAEFGKWLARQYPGLR